MPGRLLDDVAEIVSSLPSRRALLRAAAVAAVGLLVGGRRGATAAACKQGSARCRRDRECCSRTCTKQGRCRECAKESFCLTHDGCGPAGSNCQCFYTTEGTNMDRRRCVGRIDWTLPCTASSQCPAHHVCTRTCDPTFYCAALCGYDLPAPARTA